MRAAGSSACLTCRAPNSGGSTTGLSVTDACERVAAGNFFYISAVWEKVRDVILHTALRRCPLLKQTFAPQKAMSALPAKADI
jgi:hypothetical protein